MKSYNLTLTEKQQKYQHYHQVKLVNMNFLKAKKYYHLIKAALKNKLNLHIEGINQVETLKALKPEQNQELKSIEGFFSKRMTIDEIKIEINEIKKWGEKIKREDLKYKTNKYNIGDNIYAGKINIDKTEMDQSNLLEIWQNLMINLDQDQNKVRTKKINTYESINALYECPEVTINGFKSEIFPKRATKCEELKIVSPKQMFQRLPIALAQVKADKTSKKLLNEIRQIIYSLYLEKKLLKEYITI